MKKLVLLALVLVCCDSPIGAPADAEACRVLHAKPGVSQPCIFAAPADLKCSAIRSVRIDGAAIATTMFSVQCASFADASLIWLHPLGQERCSEWAVEACE